jgi:hypothetical protein
VYCKFEVAAAIIDRLALAVNGYLRAFAEVATRLIAPEPVAV